MFVSKFLKYILVILIVIFGVSCSTKKNTALTRGYHNLTSFYNILFNGDESFKKGMQKLVDTYDDDFSETLPVFLYTKKEALSVIGPEMERSIKKATKLISMHSLTVKPELKNDKELTQKQKEFFSKKEYNQFVDEAYLLMGKAQFYKMDYSLAKETFNYIISNYTEENTLFETRIWQARLANEEKRFRESEDILSSIENNLEFPKRLQGELYATWADFYLKQEKYAEAIEPLQKAIEFTSNKRIRTRYIYLLAQLYALTKNYTKASDEYNKVIRMNPPYKMTFNAKINRALTYQAGTGSRKDIDKQLHKMLKDDKNIEYQDQIYYALGNLYFTDNMVDEAVKYYRFSIEKSTENDRQKAKSSITLADIYYNKPDYVSAQAYYDTALLVIDTDYPDYTKIFTKSVSLTDLVQSIKTVEFEDSVLKLSTLPESQLLAIIDDLIEAEVRAEEERRLEQQRIAEERLNNQMESDLMAMNNQGGNWYFYNPAAKSIGHKEFLQVWGNRKLEDNWRRKNKSVISFGEITTGEEADSTGRGESTPEKVVTNPKARDFYLQYIPFTDSAKQESLKRISESLVKMGEIYSDDLKDYPKATEAYEELLKRFPSYENRLQVYYKLYSIAKIRKDIERVSLYQQKIINEYPNSNFAKLITNPNFLEEIKNQEKAIVHEYEQVYKLFNAGNYAQSFIRSQKAMENYPDHDLYAKFDYIHTISGGLKKDTLLFIIDLERLISRYPATDIAKNAQIMINYLKNSSPQVVVKQNQQIARELFKPTPDEKHYFVFIIPLKLNVNQLIFNIVNFNLDNFDDLKLEVKRVAAEGNKPLCVVREFTNSEEAMNYFNAIKQSEGIFKDVDPEGVTPFIISKTNYSKLMETGKTDQYLIFFKENYR